MTAVPTAIEILLWSLTCSLAALAVLAFKALFRHRLGARVHSLLWGLLLLRLVIPTFPSTPISVYNLVAPIRDGLQGISDDYLSNPIVVLPEDRPTATPSPAASKPTSATVPGGGGTTDPGSSGGNSGESAGMTLDTLFVSVWVAGGIALLLWFALVYLRLRTRLHQASDLVDERLDLLLEEAKDLVGLRRCRIRNVELTTAGTPFISGVLRPVLVFPAGASRLPEETLRQVLVHELVHLKRGDVWTGWLTLAFTALHWFNPFLWYVFRIVRQDLEIACDEKVLEILGDRHRVGYGQTLLSFAVPRAGWIPGSTAMTTRSGDLSRRIRFLAFVRKPSGIVAVIAIMLALAIGLLFLTDALPVGTGYTTSDITTVLIKEGAQLEPVDVDPSDTPALRGVRPTAWTVRSDTQANVYLYVFRSEAECRRAEAGFEKETQLYSWLPHRLYRDGNALIILFHTDRASDLFVLFAQTFDSSGFLSRPSYTKDEIVRLLTREGLQLEPFDLKKLGITETDLPSLAGVTAACYLASGDEHSNLQLYVFDSMEQQEQALSEYSQKTATMSMRYHEIHLGKNVLLVSFFSDGPQDARYTLVTEALAPTGIVKLQPPLTKYDIEVTFRDIGAILEPSSVPAPPVHGGVTAATYSIQGSPHSYVELFVCDSAAQRVKAREDLLTVPSDYILSSQYQEVFEGNNILLVLHLRDATSPLYAKIAEALDPHGILKIRP